MTSEADTEMLTPQEASWLLRWSIREVLISGIPKIQGQAGGVRYYRRDILRAMGLDGNPDYPISSR